MGKAESIKSKTLNHEGRCGGLLFNNLNHLSGLNLWVRTKGTQLTLSRLSTPTSKISATRKQDWQSNAISVANQFRGLYLRKRRDRENEGAVGSEVKRSKKTMAELGNEGFPGVL